MVTLADLHQELQVFERNQEAMIGMGTLLLLLIETYSPTIRTNYLFRAQYMGICLFLIYHAFSRSRIVVPSLLTLACCLAYIWSATLGSSAPLYVRYIFAIAAIAVSLLFPCLEFPKGSGPYQVGSVVHRTEDTGIVCRIFYPTQASETSSLAKYLVFGPNLAIGYGTFTRLPTFFFQYVVDHDIPAYEKEPLLKSSRDHEWPVVIFSHGLGGSVETYSHTAIDLASRGLIVFCVSHNDLSAAVTEINGEIRYFHWHDKEIVTDFALDGKLFHVRHNQLMQRQKEVRLVLDEIHNITQGKRKVGDESKFDWSDQLDMSRVAVSGHSFGCATAITVASLDQRVKSVYALDGWMFPIPRHLFDQGIEVPILHIVSKQFAFWKDNIQATAKLHKNCEDKRSRLVYVDGTRHSDFADITVQAPLATRIFSVSGKLGGLRTMRISHRMAWEFLKDTLQISDDKHGLHEDQLHSSKTLPIIDLDVKNEL